MRAPLLAVLLFSIALTGAQVSAQTPCTDGFAGDYPCDRVTLLAHLDFEALGVPDTRRGNEIWGWTDPDTGVEYALVATWDGVSFVDLSVPTAPVLVGVLRSGAALTDGGNNWRDVKTSGYFAFVVSEARSHGMQVFDLRHLRDVGRPPAVFTPDALYLDAGNAHNVVASDDLDVVAIVGYRDGRSACGGGGLHLVDMSVPTQPAYAGCYDDDGYTHDAQCIRYDGPDADYTGASVCFSSNEDLLSISDITDPAEAEGISTAIYPNPGYTHQGWLTEDRRYFLMSDESDERRGFAPGTRTLVMNVEDLDEPFFVGAYVSEVTTIDHNLYVRGDLIYQGNYESGFRLYRFDPDAPTDFEPLGFFDTYPEEDSFAFNGAWSVYPYYESGIVVIGDRERGLFVVQPEAVNVAVEENLPRPEATLEAAYPNPFRTTTTLTLSVPAPEHVRVEAYDLLGRHVATLHDGLADSALRLTFDGTTLPAGVYAVRAEGSTFAATERVSLVR